MKRLITFILLAIGFTFVPIAVTSVSAHHPVITGVATCADASGNYTVNWTVAPDAVRGYTWVIDGVAKADNQNFTYQTNHNLSGTSPSLTKTATWYTGYGTNHQVKKAGPETRTGTTTKPISCPIVTTTTSTTTTTTIAPTTTVTETTVAETTTLPSQTTVVDTTTPAATTTIPASVTPTTMADDSRFIPATGTSPILLIIALVVLVAGILAYFYSNR